MFIDITILTLCIIGVVGIYMGLARIIRICHNLEEIRKALHEFRTNSTKYFESLTEIKTLLLTILDIAKEIKDRQIESIGKSNHILNNHEHFKKDFEYCTEILETLKRVQGEVISPALMEMQRSGNNRNQSQVNPKIKVNSEKERRLPFIELSKSAEELRVAKEELSREKKERRELEEKLNRIIIRLNLDNINP